MGDIQKHQKGGLSGKPIEEKSTKLINEFYKILDGRIKIITPSELLINDYQDWLDYLTK